MRPLEIPRPLCFAAALFCCLSPSTGIGQTGPSPFNPSVSSLGMGQAGAALFWEEDRNDWANPALLGYENGLRYSHDHFLLVPTLASDVYLDVDRVAFGTEGVGLSLAGKPLRGLGGYHLDYGLSEATNENGRDRNDALLRGRAPDRDRNQPAPAVMTAFAGVPDTSLHP